MFSFSAPEATDAEKAMSPGTRISSDGVSAAASTAATTITTFDHVIRANSSAASDGVASNNRSGSDGVPVGVGRPAGIGKRSARVAGLLDSVCLACEEPRDKSCWRKKHKRGYDCMYKSAFSAKGLKNPDDDAEAPRDFLVGNMVTGSESWAFVIIFGDDKERRAGFRHPCKAIQTVVNFCIQLPEGDGKMQKRNLLCELGKFVDER